MLQPVLSAIMLAVATRPRNALCTCSMLTPPLPPSRRPLAETAWKGAMFRPRRDIEDDALHALIEMHDEATALDLTFCRLLTGPLS